MSEKKFSCREKKEAGKSCVCRMRQDPGNVGERERAVIMFTDYRSSPLTNGSGHGGTGVRGGGGGSPTMLQPFSSQMYSMNAAVGSGCLKKNIGTILVFTNK